MPWKRDIEALVELPSIPDMTIAFLVSLGACLISGAQTSLVFTSQRASNPRLMFRLLFLACSDMEGELVMIV